MTVCLAAAIAQTLPLAVSAVVFEFWRMRKKRILRFTHNRSSPSLQNKDPGGGVGSTSRGWRLVGLGVEMGRFRGGDGWV